MEGNPVEQAALEYAARGWPVLPIRAGAKVPLTRRGLHEASVSEQTILHWFDRWPDAGVAIACGHPGPTVLDIDDLNAARVDGFERPAAPTVATSRGLHAYFAGVDRPTIPLPYGELRGTGAYVLAPPSIHPDGKLYVWLDSPNGALPTVPAWLLASRRTAGTGVASVPRDPVPPGRMYEHLKDLAIRLARAGMVDPATIERMLVAEFEAVRNPGAVYGGGAHDTRRLATWAAQSDIARSRTGPRAVARRAGISRRDQGQQP